MTDIPRESSPNMPQPWGYLGVGGDAEPESAEPYSDLWQTGVHANRSPDSSIVGYESVAPIDDDELKVSTESHHVAATRGR